MAESISVLGGPSSVAVSLSRGEPGPRGHYIFTGNQDPNLETSFSQSPSLQDYFIVINPSSENYLQLYQYADTGTGSFSWVKIVKLSLNSYSTTVPMTFVNGEATIEIPVENLGITGIINNGLPQSISDSFFLQSGSSSYFNVQVSISNYNALAGLYPDAGHSLNLFPTIHTHMVQDAYLDTSDQKIKLPIKVSAVEVTDTYTVPVDSKTVFVSIFITLQSPEPIQNYLADLVSGGNS